MALLIPHYDLAKRIGNQVEIDADTVGQLIKICKQRFGEPFRQAISSTIIVVNGRSVSLLKGVKTRLGKQDQVWLIKPAGGG
jgi:molybdopterin converting factor small subunit